MSELREDVHEDGGSVLNRPFWAAYGMAMAVMGSGLPFWSWPTEPARLTVLVFSIGAFAFLAQPHLGRPVVSSMRVHNLAIVHRNTLLVGLFVLLVASYQPPAWAAGVDALLLAGYLLLLDLVTIPTTTFRRLTSPAVVIVLAALVIGSTALIAIPATDASYRPLLAALAAATALAAALSTAFTRAETRRVGSRGTSPQNQDRSPQ
jgi:hypothetical protein